MDSHDLMSDEAALNELGERLSRCRLDRQWTQAELAEQAGIGKTTLERLEAGQSTNVKNLIRVMRALGLLGSLFAAVPETGPRPIDLLERRGKVRQRASRVRAEDADEPWQWDDE